MCEEGFPGCVGFIEGTTVPLAQKPAFSGTAYLDRKKRYSINVQVVCDVDKRIIAFDIGSPGSSPDSTVYKLMEVYQHPEDYFESGEYLLADSAYPLSTTCIPAYRPPQADRRNNAAFNHCLARSRARSERCIGILKGRWTSLSAMRGQVNSINSMEVIVQWIHSCCVLHNMLAHQGEPWQDAFIETKPRNLDRLQEPTAEARTFRDTLRKTVLETNTKRGVLIRR